MPDVDEPSAEAPRRGLASPHVDAVRAGVVVVLFLVALALLLGPAGNLVGSSTTSTTQPHHHLPPVQKNKVTVQVANGTSIEGLANSWTQGLQTRYGWAALAAVSTNGFHPTETWIYFKAHEQQAAKLLAAELKVDPKDVTLLTRQALDAVPGAANDDVVIVIGTQHHGEGVATG